MTCILSHSSLEHQEHYIPNFVKIFAECYDEEGLGKLRIDEKLVSVQGSKTGEDSLVTKEDLGQKRNKNNNDFRRSDCNKGLEQNMQVPGLNQNHQVQYEI